MGTSTPSICEDGLRLQFEGLHSWRRVELASKIVHACEERAVSDGAKIALARLRAHAARSEASLAGCDHWPRHQPLIHDGAGAAANRSATTPAAICSGCEPDGSSNFGAGGSCALRRRRAMRRIRPHPRQTRRLLPAAFRLGRGRALLHRREVAHLREGVRHGRHDARVGARSSISAAAVAGAGHLEQARTICARPGGGGGARVRGGAAARRLSAAAERPVRAPRRVAARGRRLPAHGQQRRARGAPRGVAQFRRPMCRWPSSRRTPCRCRASPSRWTTSARSRHRLRRRLRHGVFERGLPECELAVPVERRPVDYAAGGAPLPAADIAVLPEPR